MRHYEVMFLVHPDQSEQVPAMIQRYKQMMTNKGGKVHRSEDWGRRPLAYSINNVHKAHYVLLNIECDKPELDEIHTSFRFNDAVLRHMTIKLSQAIKSPSPVMRRPKKETESQ